MNAEPELPDWLEELGGRHGVRFELVRQSQGVTLQASRHCLLGCSRFTTPGQYVWLNSPDALRSTANEMIRRLTDSRCRCEVLAHELGLDEVPE